MAAQTEQARILFGSLLSNIGLWSVPEVLEGSKGPKDMPAPGEFA
jgi:hypothetical protein